MWFRTVSGFFLLMGAGAALEHAFKVVTGRRVGGIWGLGVDNGVEDCLGDFVD
jgi:hypothetical protein